MNTISESVNHWRTPTEVAVAPNPVPESEIAFTDEATEDDGFRLFGEDGFTFLDFLDIINPLQHIPFIGTMYRNMSDDTLDPGSRVLGSTLFFGPVGTVASVANVLVENSTGKDIGDHVMAMIEDEPTDAPEDANAPSVARPQTIADAGRRFGTSETEAVNPVTAWAMSEIAYRKSAAEKARPLTVSQAPATTTTQATAVSDIAAWTATWAAGTEQAMLSPATDNRPTPPTAATGDIPVWTATWAAGTEQAMLSPTMGNRSTPARTSRSVLRAAALARDTRHGAQLYAAGTYGMNRPTAGNPKPDREAAATPGAIAAGGGWFSESRSTGHEKYQAGAGLAAIQRPLALDLTR